VGHTDKDYYTALGYKYENDTIEKQDKYLKRMAGVAYLFAALAVTHLPRESASGRPHPFGPRYIWRYLAAVMNCEPQADVTATVLLQVLEVTGSLMFHHYGIQFLKLLAVLQARFLPLLETVKTDGGPTARLEAFLMAALSAKTVAPPKGRLDYGFL
jgi:nucleoporin GLE1